MTDLNQRLKDAIAGESKEAVLRAMANAIRAIPDRPSLCARGDTADVKLDPRSWTLPSGARAPFTCRKRCNWSIWAKNYGSARNRCSPPRVYCCV
jgi:hypothetical protein